MDTMVIAVLLKNTRWQVNAKRVERIWRREGLKVPMKQPKRGRLWFNDGGYVIDNCSSRMLNFSGTTEKHPEV